MGKIVFLDIDGTLVNFDQQMPKSAFKALKEARENGHKLALCTGRTYGHIYPWLLEFGFDAIVASAGAYVRIGEEVLYHHVIDFEKLQGLVKLLRKHKIDYLLQGLYGRMVPKECIQGIEDHFASINPDYKEHLAGIEQIECISKEHIIESMMYFNSNVGIDQLQKEIDEELDGYFWVTGASYETDREHNGEITCRGIHKADGMKRVTEYFSLDPTEVIAFGDGPNDFEMLQYAQIGVAMGNAVESLKSKADYITDDIQQDGIYNAFLQLGLIEG